LRKLTRLLEASDIARFVHELAGASSVELMLAIREHKVLLKAPVAVRPDAAAAIATAAASALTPPEADRLARQLDLLMLVADRQQRFQAGAGAFAAALPTMSTADLLQIAQKAFNRFAHQFIDADKQWHDLDRPVGLVEREWHDLNGRIADVIAAVCRAVNLASSRVDRRRHLRNDLRYRAEQTFLKLVSLCSVMNGLDWIRDSTAFGDLDVFSIEPGDTPVVILEFRDPRRSLLRTLGVRREVVMESFARRPDRLVGRWLDANVAASIHNATARYLRTVRASAAERVDVDAAFRSAKVHLNALDFEDDMLLMTWESDRRIAGRYLLSASLQWSEIAAQAVAKGLPKSAARRFLPAPIAFADLLDDIGDPEWEEVIRKAWDETTVTLPVTNHWDLVRRPFVRDDDGVARPLLHGATGRWNAAIRERLLHGGALAKEVGAKWEKYFAARFRESGWLVVGEGVKLRAGGKVLTDVDLLVVRDDLLLVVQVKALGGSALNPYDHWKNRLVIEKGCRQAALAHHLIQTDASLIRSIAGRAVADRIRVFEQVVLSNSGLFDGWEHAGVPVLGETLLKSITVGSKVDYVDSETGRTVHTRHLLRLEELTTETIVKALRAPIELAIAPESGAVAHFQEKVAGIDFRIPEFTAAEMPTETFASPQR
jgi:hypothetical protein